MSNKITVRAKGKPSIAKRTKGPKSTPPPTPAVDPYDIFVHAMRFRTACTLTGSAFGLSDDYMLPHTVLLAFAIELSLKCLLHLTGRKPKRSHRLKEDLFDALDSSTKTRITEYFDEAFSVNPTLRSFMTDPEFRKECANAKFDVASVIARANDFFVSVRYWHENKTDMFPEISGSAGTIGLSDAFLAINKVIVELKPDFEKAVTTQFAIYYPPPPERPVIDIAQLNPNALMKVHRLTF